LAFVQQHLFSSDSLDEQHAEKAKGQNEQAQAQETSKAFTKKEQVICIGLLSGSRGLSFFADIGPDIVVNVGNELSIVV
jgi:hypothetical protein